ncbi:hypothetical protein D3C77_664090 [compost metagenome]
MEIYNRLGLPSRISHSCIFAEIVVADQTITSNGKFTSGWSTFCRFRSSVSNRGIYLPVHCIVAGAYCRLGCYDAFYAFVDYFSCVDLRRTL